MTGTARRNERRRKRYAETGVRARCPKNCPCECHKFLNPHPHEPCPGKIKERS